MADPRLILGRIVNVQGTTPGPAGGIAYTIAVHDPAVDGVYRLELQRPLRRWPDDIDIVACEVGEIVIGTVSSNRVQWHFHEYPDFAACPTGSPGARPADPEFVERLRRMRETQFAIGTVPSGGQQNVPAPSEG